MLENNPIIGKMGEDLAKDIVVEAGLNLLMATYIK